jgi:hypothetical protein
MVGRLERFIRDGRAIMSLETPEEMAERLHPTPRYPFVKQPTLDAQRHAIEAIRADREAIAAALLEEASRLDAGGTPLTGVYAADALRAFADRLVPGEVRCAHCHVKAVAYDGAVYCGAACCAKAEVRR